MFHYNIWILQNLMELLRVISSMFTSDSHVSMRSNKMDKSTFLVWSSWRSLTPKPFHVELVKPFISKDWCCAHLDMMRWNCSTLKIDLNFNFDFYAKLHKFLSFLKMIFIVIGFRHRRCWQSCCLLSFFSFALSSFRFFCLLGLTAHALVSSYVLWIQINFAFFSFPLLVVFLSMVSFI